MTDKAGHPCGMSFLAWLAMMFIVLKLTGHIDWSWWGVTAPLWAPVACAVVVLLIAAFAGAVVGIAEFYWESVGDAVKRRRLNRTVSGERR